MEYARASGLSINSEDGIFLIKRELISFGLRKNLVMKSKVKPINAVVGEEKRWIKQFAYTEFEGKYSVGK
ncbi:MULTISPECIES: hypothetical protein [unclassified Serratia (in: enterobacteria)]|uniref:hypothetical protein n=1 Tax=unclassified Serratia (in: enterobacteria) TaxID=2647522 RepID=UPI0030760BED